MNESTSVLLRRALRLGLALLFLHQVGISAHAQTSIASWGNNSDSQLQVPSGLTTATAVAGGAMHSLALKSDGTVVGWGNNLFVQATPPPGLAGVTAVSAGGAYSLALRSNGTVVVWGSHPAPPSDLTNAVAIAAGAAHSLALRADRTVVSWGEQTVVPEHVTNIIAIAAGNGHSLALRANETVVAWGDNTFGESTVPPGLTNVIAIAAGQDHSLALRRNGTIVAWGRNQAGQTNVPAGLTNIVAITAGALHNLALRANGTVVAWGDNSFGQSTVPALAGFFGIAAGGSHSFGVRGNGAPVILVQPVSQTLAFSKNASFHVTAVGTQPLAYQWRRNGVNIAGATNATLTLNNIPLADPIAYSVVISNTAGIAISADAILTTVPEPPTIAVQPQDLTRICGQTATLTVTADGSAPFSYQWLFEGEPLPARTNRNLALGVISSTNAGPYAVIVTNAFGAITSEVATLTVDVVPPPITSSLTASGKQGVPFTYTITAQYSPVEFAATDLPAGLELNETNGVISGIPEVNGTHLAEIIAINSCTSSTQTLTLTFASSVPVITSAPSAEGVEEEPFTYQITATESPTSFWGENLPFGLKVNSLTGEIFGKAVYAGTFTSTIYASNMWGVGSAQLQFTFELMPIEGLSIANITYNYSSPYLLDFQFSLRDNDDPASGRALVVPPALLSALTVEGTQTNSASETAYLIERGNTKVIKANLVLDFTGSIASLDNGDSNQDGISDAVDELISGAQEFVNQQPADAQIGVFEFHRDDMDPAHVVSLTTDKTRLNDAIAGIWTNYVHNFSSGSRCWDALLAAVEDLGTPNPDEEHYVIFVSDGRDESSLVSMDDVITAATNNHVKIYCIGFGAELETDPLMTITAETDGRYYTAEDAAELAAHFAEIGKDLNSFYLLRWATLKRTSTPFMPAFQITYNGHDAYTPENPWDTIIEVDDTTTPPTTNTTYVTNFIIGPYTPITYAGPVTVGALRLVGSDDGASHSVTLRTTYTPRNIRQIRIHYRPNWPCTATLLSAGENELLRGWSLSETNDGAGGRWLTIASPAPQFLTNSIRFAAWGNLIKFTFRDMVDPTNAFSHFTVDNTIYQMTGGQSFVISNVTDFITVYPVLTYGTPVPWLMNLGYTDDFELAELDDIDLDGVPNWKEYQANTDPFDPDSRFIVHGLSRDPSDRIQITFSTALERLYRVEYSADFVDWEILQEDIPGTGSDVTVTDTASPPDAGQMFYRVAVY